MVAAERLEVDRSRYYYQSLVSLLEPDLGRKMAVTTIRQYCGALGIHEGAITAEHIDPIAGLIEGGLASFVGRQRLDVLVVQIKRIKEYDDWGVL